MRLGYFPIATAPEPLRGPVTNITSAPPESPPPTTPTTTTLQKLVSPVSPKTWPTLPLWWKVASAAGGVGGMYHGYKRDKSVLWALVYGFAGSLFPVIVLPLMLAQGFGKPKGK